MLPGERRYSHPIRVEDALQRRSRARHALVELLARAEIAGDPVDAAWAGRYRALLRELEEAEEDVRRLAGRGR